ncbi:MAG: rhomboid family intramembrane serine protease [Actinomycetales bacterium]|nr:rhomboid family intramembrane serine protease [Actinomycetales bacterium]
MGPSAVAAVWVTFLAGWVVLRGAVLRGSDVTSGRDLLRRIVPRPWAVALWCAVAVPSLVQLVAAPGLLGWGERANPEVAAGQWWRLATAVVLQDGGWAGTAFNLSVLAVTLVLVGAVWRALPTVLVFAVGGVLANLLTVLTSGPAGAGNSMATLCLVAAAAVTTVLSGEWSWGTALPVLLIVAAAATLLVVHDEHGPAVVLGLVTGLLLDRSGVRVGQDASVVPS